MTSFYDQLFRQQVDPKACLKAAAEATATAYLDGKPRLIGKRKITSTERDAAFWSCSSWTELSDEIWQSELMVLALARYFAQERTANVELLAHIAIASPSTVVKAVRYSGLVLRQHSPRRGDLEQIAPLNPNVAELCNVLHIFDQAYRERATAVAHWKTTLAELTPFELLIYASLYAFEHTVPLGLESSQRSDGIASDTEQVWDTINDILLWKLSAVPGESLQLNEAELAQSLAKHLSPFLFPLPATQAIRHDLRAGFHSLLLAQTELNEFVSRSADAFSYDDGIQFVRKGTSLEIEQIDAGARAAWERDGRKLARLHEYWFYRALDDFAGSGMATRTIGQPENHDANRLAFIQAMRTQLRLAEVYGVADEVTTDAGTQVNLFQALLSLELMSAHFLRDFLGIFIQHFQDTGDWADALSKLALSGLREGRQNRFPLTWSDRSTKITNIAGWTVSPELPQGSPRMAAAILDFWTSDWMSLSSQLRNSESAMHPALFERPILKFGQYLVQLPWQVGMQNNGTAAINNLRRLGARRGEVRTETQRIETQLGRLFESRGFRVVLNWHPSIEEYGNPGEVDLICSRDGLVFVLEVKSTFVRKTKRDAWLHATTTLRKAGQQLQRKVAAVRSAVVQGSELAVSLGLEPSQIPTTVHGWIVDTSIESDHQRFSGFLKLSLEELLIALRDDRDLLYDPDQLFSGHKSVPVAVSRIVASEAGSLYPSGFTADKLVDVVETQAVWAEI